MSANFNLTFKNKNVLITWKNSEIPQKAPQTYGLYGKVGSVSEWVSALNHNMAGTYPIQSDGKFLHRPYAEALSGMGDDNVGYLSGTALLKEIEEGAIPERKEGVDVEVWYRVHSRYSATRNVCTLWTQELKWQDEQKGEPEFVKHDRNSIALMPYMQYMRKAEETNTPISLMFSESVMFLYEGLKANWEAFQVGNIDFIKENMNKKALVSNFKSSIDRAELYAQKMHEAGTPIEGVDFGTDAPVIGTRIVFYFVKTGELLEGANNYRDVTEDNILGIINAMKQTGLGWKLAPAAVQVQGRNVPQPVE